ncbi:uncharacterized protein LOC110856235 [Folsomia candida]|uniref:Dopamine N-acetyltransferase n=1 Tax=Folsomia candida TaxID=158441 RepID=A0A226DMV0_FOLCA|nr:uncharacterized protein LOC110856235 [Folsomia candida]OXA46509.1 Dopamine N-acetyltransferase [Folsomia candida]
MDSDLINGAEWGNFEFKSVQEKDFGAVLTHLRDSFYKDEPTQIVMGMTEDRANDLDDRIRTFLVNGMSFMAICKVTRKIAGVVVMEDCFKDKKYPVLTPTSPITPKVRHFFTILEDSVNIFEKYGVEKYAAIFILSVHQDFRGCGLATEMFRRAVQVLKLMSYSIIECTFSNPFSRRIGEKFGFIEVSRTKYVDAKDAQGNFFMLHAKPDQFVNMTILDLRETQ